MASNATIHDALNPPDAAVPPTARILHLPITTDAEAFDRVARASERVLVLLAEPGASQRRALASFVVAGIEAELDRLGAAPRGWVASDALEEIVHDQLYRARLLGCFGIAVSFAAVTALADAQSRLSAEDSETLRRLVALAEREPLQLHLPRPSAELMIAGAPQPLSTWLPPSREPGRVATIEYDSMREDERPGAGAVAPSARVTLLPPLLEAFFDPPPLPEESESSRDAVTPATPVWLPRVGARAARSAKPRVAAEAVAEPAADAAVLAPLSANAEVDLRQAEAEREREPAMAEPSTTDATDAAHADVEVEAREVHAVEASIQPADIESDAIARADAGIAAATVESAAVELAAVEAAEVERELAAVEAAAVEAAGVELAQTPTPATAIPAQTTTAETPAPQPVTERTEAERLERCRAWAAQLQGMTGPKAHGAVEKAFMGAYLPLCREISAGGAPEPARTARDRWAEGFAQSYASAFRHLGARRPRMVRDVVELGSRWLGQHHARQCQLLLISAMRFDLGQRLNEEIERRLTGKAVCVEQCLLWTALPSNAEAQQLGEARNAARRGRVEAPPLAPSNEIESGYVGSRELFRLRQLPDVLACPGDVEAVRLGQLASGLADTLVPWIQRQPPETLVVIFGDHGFHWDATPAGTSAAQRGGALPEQVLVPASAWLLREPRTRPKTAPGIH
jgi:hypothetical protein